MSSRIWYGHFYSRHKTKLDYAADIDYISLRYKLNTMF